MLAVPFHWHNEPFLLILILGIAWIYSVLLGPLIGFFDDYYDAKIYSKRKLYKQKIVFYIGLILVYLTVASPLDQLGEDYLFSAHMLQHMILIYIIPPLFFYGVPFFIIDKILSFRILYRMMKFLFNPAVGGIFFIVGYSIWHLPPIYEAAIQNKYIHILEHAVMFLTAVQIWWPLISGSHILKKSNPGVGMLLIFILMVAQYPVFAYITFSDTVLYATYEYAPRIVALSPLQDQVLAGVIMNIFNMVVSLLLFGICFYNWYKKDQLAVYSFKELSS